MKRILLLVLLVGLLKAYGQNEFAATSFYNTFNEILADSKNGFTAYKGAKITGPYSEISNKYQVKLMLPLADSGKIMEPLAGNPYVIYYFEPEKKKKEIDKRAVYLRDAILTATGVVLYARTYSTNVANRVFSDTFIFTDPDETNTAAALFRISIFYLGNKYRLLLEIRGNKS